MERVETLLQKLQQQFANGATAEQLLLTTQMLEHELVHLLAKQAPAAKASVVVSMPLQAIPTRTVPANTIEKQPSPEERTVQVLQVDEDEVAEDQIVEPDDCRHHDITEAHGITGRAVP